jgi:Temperature dependent protein affecting M2 dsRNA replication
MIYHLEQGVIDGVYGSSELFLYGAEKIITRLSLHHQTPHSNEEVNGNVKKEPEFVPEKSTFSFIEREACLKALGDLSPEAFIDALLATGSSYLATFPPILGQQPISFRHIVDLLGNCQHDIHRLCSLYPHDEHLSHSNWEDRFIRAHVAIHHMPILIGRDTVKPRSALDQGRFGRIPNSLHDIVGLTLPEELLFYLYQGMIGPRVLNWLISGKVMVYAPLAGGDASVYRTLVKDQLAEWRRQALGILVSSINRYFQIRDVKTTYWFGESGESFNMKNATSSQPILSTWRVKKGVLQEEAKKHPPHKAAGIGSLSFSVRALTSAEFAPKTICEKSATFDPLVDSDEIVANAIWRGLHLRGFVDDTHQLTKWGQVLATVIGTLGNDASREQVEAAFVSVELLRLGILSGDEMFPSAPNTASKGSGEFARLPILYLLSCYLESDKRHVALLSRIAATGRMRHPVRGYSGPLNRQVLSYHCIISEVRSALRDLFEMALAVLFLEASAKRIRDDYTLIAKLYDSPFPTYTASLIFLAFPSKRTTPLA